MEPFATRLRERAAELGLSNAEVARRSGLGERRYGHYVAGVREPDLASLVRIANTLGTTPNSLLGFGEPEPASTRERLLSRLQSAAAGLPDDDLELVVAD